MITIPQRRTEAIELVDEAIANLRTLHCAMNDPSGIDDAALRALASVLGRPFANCSRPGIGEQAARRVII
ncbi:hypothetical protein [Nitrobacter sp.]|uniref:hypothetical protein n=1 Tax=Nitrobacter sp. TaxID=29420 RepID=UPI001D9BB2F6|nr:hypothetical protein [Nitrobacter sp.]MCB1393789.1 hypothetical protein [Nitrobacter sp.]